MEPNNNFYLVRELAAMLRVCDMTIYRYIKMGRIKAYKIGKEFRVEQEEFQCFMKKVKTS